MDKEFVAFDGDDQQELQARHLSWCTKAKNAVLINRLFDKNVSANYGVMQVVVSNNSELDDLDSDGDDPNDTMTLDDMVILFLRAYGVELATRLRKGVWKDFLPGCVCVWVCVCLCMHVSELI